MFDFERDHNEIDEELEEEKDRGYIREYYMRFTTRGIYPSDVAGKTHYRSVEDELNAKMTLKQLTINNILNTNDESVIKYAIDNAPIDTYHSFLKCAIYTLNDFAVQYLVENWPFESLELIKYLQEAFSSLLLFYCTDISSYTGKIASEVHKWILIGDKYVKMITDLFLANRLKENVKFCKLDISGLPISQKLFSRLIDLYYKHVFNHESLFKPPVTVTTKTSSKEHNRVKIDDKCAKQPKRKKKSDDEDDDDDGGGNYLDDLMSSSDSSNNDEKQHDEDDDDDDDDEDNSEYERNDIMRCIKRTFFDMSDSDEDVDDQEANESSDVESLPSLESVSPSDNDDDDNDQDKKKSKKSSSKEDGFSCNSKRRGSRFKANKSRLVIRLDFDETYSHNLERFMKCHDYMSQLGLSPDELMFDLNIVRLNMTVQHPVCKLIQPSFEHVAKKITGLSLFFVARAPETKLVFSMIKHFANITELNVSAYGSDQQLRSILSIDHPEYRAILHASLGSLTQLKRLRLNALDLASHTRLLLDSLAAPLEHLNLTSCRLNTDDLEYLVESKHASSLRSLILSNDDLESKTPIVRALLAKCSRTLEILDLGCNSFAYDAYMTLVDEMVKMPRLKLLVTLNLFTFDNYLKIADKLNCAPSFLAWRLNFSTDYYQLSVKIRSKFKFRKFKSDYLKSLQNKFDARPVKITINDPDLNYILHEIF